MLKKRLRQLRSELELTQGKIAEKLNMALTTYANYEQGTRSPEPETLCRLADVFNVTVDYLLGRTEIRQGMIVEGNMLPPELRGMIDGIEILKDGLKDGLSKEDIKEILAAAAKIKRIRGKI